MYDSNDQTKSNSNQSDWMQSLGYQTLHALKQTQTYRDFLILTNQLVDAFYENFGFKLVMIRGTSQESFISVRRQLESSIWLSLNQKSKKPNKIFQEENEQSDQKEELAQSQNKLQIMIKNDQILDLVKTIIKKGSKVKDLFDELSSETQDKAQSEITKIVLQKCMIFKKRVANLQQIDKLNEHEQRLIDRFTQKRNKAAQELQLEQLKKKQCDKQLKKSQKRSGACNFMSNVLLTWMIDNQTSHNIQRHREDYQQSKAMITEIDQIQFRSRLELFQMKKTIESRKKQIQNNLNFEENKYEKLKKEFRQLHENLTKQLKTKEDQCRILPK